MKLPTKKIIVAIRQFLKNHFSAVIIILTFGVALWTLIITKEGVNDAKENLKLIKQEQERTLDPLIHYKYLADSKEFEVLSNNDVEIKKVSWILTTPKLIKVNEFSNKLILDELKYSLLLELNEKNRDIVKSFINCYLFGSEFYRGIPLIGDIEFRRRGNRETFRQIDLLRIKGAERDGLYIYVEKPGVSTEDVEKYKIQTKEDYKIYKDFLSDYSADNSTGNCDIQFGYPRKDFWQ